MLTEQEAGIFHNSKHVGLVWRTFLAKTFTCLLLTGMSVYIIAKYWDVMDTSTYFGFKIIGCCVSFFILIPALWETISLTSILGAVSEHEQDRDRLYEDAQGANCCEDWFVLSISLICCCPCRFAFCAYVYFMHPYKSTKRRFIYSLLAFTIAFIDTVQTLMLFPLSVVVIMTSDSEVDVFVNLVAVQVFGNLDDIVAYGVSKYQKPKVQASTIALYLTWEGGKAKDDSHARIASEVKDLAERVQLLEEKNEPIV